MRVRGRMSEDTGPSLFLQAVKHRVGCEMRGVEGETKGKVIPQTDDYCRSLSLTGVWLFYLHLTNLMLALIWSLTWLVFCSQPVDRCDGEAAPASLHMSLEYQQTAFVPLACLQSRSVSDRKSMSQSQTLFLSFFFSMSKICIKEITLNI